MTIRAGIIGLGFMGRRYAETLARLQGVTVTAVSDTRPDVAAGVSGAIGARVAENAEALAGAADVDAVFVCTPEDAHVDASLAALAAGKALMIEKPVADTLDGAARIRDAARAAGTVVMVGHLLRFEPRWAAAHRLVSTGAIGRVVSIATRRVGNVRDQEVLRGRTTIPLYYGVHDLDIVRWLAGVPAVSMQAARRGGVLRAAGYDIDDLYHAIVRFEGDLLATAELGWHVPASALAAPTAGFSVVGTDGWLRVEQGQTGLEVHAGEATGTGRLSIDTSFWPEVHGRPAGALTNELEHFLDCVRTGGRPVISLDDAIEALRLSLAMEAAAATGATVDLATFGVAR